MNIPVEVPQKTELDEPPPEIQEQVVLKLFADGHAELNRRTVTPEQLEEKLRSKMAGRSERVMFFEGEDTAVYGYAVKLMDIAKGAGVTTIGIMTPGDTENDASALQGDAYAAAYSGRDGQGGPRLGRIGAGQPTVIGGADPASLAAVVQRYFSDLLACYEQEAAAGRVISGTVTTKVEINGSGTVVSASTQASSMGNPVVEGCIAQRFRAMSFPAGQASTVSFPIGFQPNAAP